MKNVLEWLEASADRFPAKVAFADTETELTFIQLQTRAQAIGTWLAQRIVACEPVAFYLEKSAAAIAGMLGTVYARGHYCVLDVRQPPARLAQIVDTLRPALVLSDAAHIEEARSIFEPLGCSVFQIGPLCETRADAKMLARIRGQADIADPLYVNFTSGSTGTPKGVVVAHRSVIEFIGHFTRIFDFSEVDRIANQAPFDFDVSVKDIYSGLACGASVYLIPREYFSIPVRLMDYLCDNQVTVCTWAVSAMCFVSTMGGFAYRTPSTIRAVIFSGEVMPAKHLAIWRSALPRALFVNVYGPTEVTCNCTYFVVERDYDADEPIPIGKPFPGENVFLLDESNRKIEAPGIVGEICVGGETLALGYCNEPERTARVFVQNPLNAQPETIYRTGDLADYDTEGNLVYRGRKDHQIKHLGQRIELGEIESAAQGHASVMRACCIYDERKKRIRLYYVGECEKDVLSGYLKHKLPNYMVPNKVVKLDEMPLNKNGKIDRTALVAL